ncbi:PBECR4 domain-containing protein [Fructobacillus ficulneus]|nr:PBECR4 domain-containing protein [Fructobacillus ficulneus]
MDKDFSTKEKQNDILKKWQRAADFFDENFTNRLVSYCYKKDGAFYEITIRFQKHNFQHLMGIHYDRGASRFWSHVVKGNVDFSSVKVNSYNAKKYKPYSNDKRSVFVKKLNALQDLDSLIKKQVRIVESGRIGNVVFEHLIRSHRVTIALATKRENNSVSEYILSNINLDNELSSKHRGYPVINLYSCNLQGGDEKFYF